MWLVMSPEEDAGRVRIQPSGQAQGSTGLASPAGGSDVSHLGSGIWGDSCILNYS